MEHAMTSVAKGRKEPSAQNHEKLQKLFCCAPKVALFLHLQQQKSLQLQAVSELETIHRTHLPAISLLCRKNKATTEYYHILWYALYYYIIIAKGALPHVLKIIAEGKVYSKARLAGN